MLTPNDLAFVPQVANDHINASFSRSLGLATLGAKSDQLKGAPGTVQTFPYWKKMGGMQKPAVNEGLTPDKLVDDKFTFTVQEAGKAASWSDAAIMASGAGTSPEDVRSKSRQEALRQFGIIAAEQIDQDVVDLISNSANYKVGYTAADANGKLTIGSMLDLKIGAFGDKQSKAVAIAMHSLNFATLMKDSSAGFLKADATQPLYGRPGYEGLFLGQAVFVLDQMPQVNSVGGMKTFAVYTFKAEPFAIAWKKDFMPEEDRDILMRETLIAGTMWYGMTGLHCKIANDDYRIGYGTFASEVAG